MDTKAQRAAAARMGVDQRRSADRRSKPRAGNGSSRGRRATDAAEARSAQAGETPSLTVRKRRATRDGREPLVVYLQPQSIKALKIAALEQDSTASAIVAQALDAWFRGQERRPGR